MRRMRFLVATLIIWLFLFYNVERLSEPINITSVAYTFVPLVAVINILTPRLRKVPLVALLVLPLPVFLALKSWMGLRLWGIALPLTVTEICIIAVTTILARWVSNGVNEFERAIANGVGIEEVPGVPAEGGAYPSDRAPGWARHGYPVLRSPETAPRSNRMCGR